MKIQINLTTRRVILAAVAALTLIGGSALGANVVKRYRGTVVADRFNGAILAIAGTDITSTAAELNYNDVTTAGTVQASKAAVVDSNKDIGDFRNLDATNFDAGLSGTAGTYDVFPSTAAKGKITLQAADSAGDTTTTITNASQAGARTYTIPDAGASASFGMSEGAATWNGVKTFGSVPVFPTGGITANATTITETEFGYIDALTAGAAAASKFLLLDSVKAITGVGHIAPAAGSAFTAADPNPSRTTLRANAYFLVDTTANAVDLDFSDDADLEAADLGKTWKFIVSAGGTNALTVTDGASGVLVKLQAAAGATCEDPGDRYECTAYALEAVSCTSFCGD